MALLLRRITLFGAVALSSFGLAACEPEEAKPADPEAAQQMSNLVVDITDEIVSTVSSISESEMLGSLAQGLGAIESVAGSDDGSGGSEAIKSYGKKLGKKVGKKLMLAFAEEEPSGDELGKFLRENVFTEANYEGDGVYLLKGRDFCDSGDTKCIEDFDDAEVRIKAVLAGDGIDVTIIIGPEKSEPIVLELRPRRLSVVVDLGEMVAAANHIAEISSDDGVSEEQITVTASGVIAVSLVVNGKQDVTLSVDIKKAINLEVKNDKEGEFVTFSTEARQPLASIRAEGLEETISFLFNMGQTTLSMPWEMFNDESDAGGLFKLDLKGVSFAFRLNEKMSELEIENIGLGNGQSTIKLNDHTLIAVDLNKDASRRFDFSIAPDDPNLPLFSFDPEFDLLVYLNLAPLKDDGEDVPDFLIDETYEIKFNGTNPTAQPIEEDYATDTKGGIKIVSGTLTLSSSKAKQPVVVSAGQCLVGDPVTDGEHALLGAFAAGTCD
ncbi:MAG: hypothetical protein V2A73_06220 [Pseudomonadota bacterium]